jgi:hypothetical protein
LRAIGCLGLTLAPLLPASDPVFLGILPGASILVATFVASFASGFGIHLLMRRHGRWWTLAGIACALLTNMLALTTLQAIILVKPT